MRFLYIILLLVLIIGGGCSNSKIRSSSVVPEIPDSLSTDEEKASYFVTHFWDEVDFKDRSMSLDTAFMEQSFSNFIAMIPVVPEDIAGEAIRQLVGKAAEDDAAFNLLAQTADLYLDHPDSPMRDEDTYILFLNSFIGSPATPEHIRQIYEYKLAQAIKNRPGIPAPDFTVITREGRRADLYSLLIGDENIVMFYDPDCDHCEEASQRLANLNLKQGVAVIAIDVAGDRQEWERKKGSLPSEWTVTFSLEDIEDRELFYFRALPTFYVLDSSGIILSKDVTI